MHLKAKNIAIYFICFLVNWNLTSAQTYSIVGGDTINRVDELNRKQGQWVYNGKMKNLPEYGPTQKVEEGEYKDNRKIGVWKKYYPNKSVKDEITFVNNQPTGPYTIYYENGQIMEQGNWKRNRNIGKFTRYYENGEKHQEFNFNNVSGKREGIQKYYHENGQLMIEGDWKNGKEAGELKEYYANGELRSIKYFNDGEIDPAKTVHKDPTQAITQKPVVEPLSSTPPPAKKGTSKTNPFDGNGFNTLYNRNKQIVQKGIFKNGKLMDGKWYRYDSDGLLKAIEVYKGGRYVGNGVISEDDK